MRERILSVIGSSSESVEIAPSEYHVVTNRHVDSTWVTKSIATSRECYGEEGLGY
jgi:hypothetical protein